MFCSSRRPFQASCTRSAVGAGILLNFVPVRSEVGHCGNTVGSATRPILSPSHWNPSQSLVVAAGRGAASGTRILVSLLHSVVESSVSPKAPFPRTTPSALSAIHQQYFGLGS